MRVNGPALRAIRTDQRATLRQIAAAAGISAAYLSRIERNHRGSSGISDDTAHALAVALSMPIEAIAASNRSAA